MYSVSSEDKRALRRDKYGNDPHAAMAEDLARLALGEPLGYVIGWIPFLGLRIHLDSQPLIPRPETEWWTERLLAHLREKFGDSPFSFLDLCAGSGAIGLSVLAKFPNARVSFAELVPEHIALIQKNIKANGLDASRGSLYISDMFDALPVAVRFDTIAVNPPYIPEGRALPKSVIDFEPRVALFGGPDGLALIGRIALEAPGRLKPKGELWLECDSEHATAAKDLFVRSGARTELHTDQYGRPRLLVSYW